MYIAKKSGFVLALMSLLVAFVAAAVFTVSGVARADEKSNVDKFRESMLNYVDLASADAITEENILGDKDADVELTGGGASLSVKRSTLWTNYKTAKMLYTAAFGEAEREQINEDAALKSAFEKVDNILGTTYNQYVLVNALAPVVNPSDTRPSTYDDHEWVEGVRKNVDALKESDSKRYAVLLYWTDDFAYLAAAETKMADRVQAFEDIQAVIEQIQYYLGGEGNKRMESGYTAAIADENHRIVLESEASIKAVEDLIAEKNAANDAEKYITNYKDYSDAREKLDAEKAAATNVVEDAKKIKELVVDGEKHYTLEVDIDNVWKDFEALKTEHTAPDADGVKDYNDLQSLISEDDKGMIQELHDRLETLRGLIIDAEGKITTLAGKEQKYTDEYRGLIEAVEEALKKLDKDITDHDDAVYAKDEAGYQKLEGEEAEGYPKGTHVYAEECGKYFVEQYDKYKDARAQYDKWDKDVKDYETKVNDLIKAYFAKEKDVLILHNGIPGEDVLSVTDLIEIRDNIFTPEQRGLKPDDDGYVETELGVRNHPVKEETFGGSDENKIIENEFGTNPEDYKKGQPHDYFTIVLAMEGVYNKAYAAVQDVDEDIAELYGGLNATYKYSDRDTFVQLVKDYNEKCEVPGNGRLFSYAEQLEKMKKSFAAADELVKAWDEAVKAIQMDGETVKRIVMGENDDKVVNAYRAFEAIIAHVDDYSAVFNDMPATLAASALKTLTDVAAKNSFAIYTAAVNEYAYLRYEFAALAADMQNMNEAEEPDTKDPNSLLEWGTQLQSVVKRFDGLLTYRNTDGTATHTPDEVEGNQNYFIEEYADTYAEYLETLKKGALYRVLGLIIDIYNEEGVIKFDDHVIVLGDREKIIDAKTAYDEFMATEGHLEVPEPYEGKLEAAVEALIDLTIGSEDGLVYGVNEFYLEVIHIADPDFECGVSEDRWERTVNELAVLKAKAKEIIKGMVANEEGIELFPGYPFDLDEIARLKALYEKGDAKVWADGYKYAGNQAAEGYLWYAYLLLQDEIGEKEAEKDQEHDGIIVEADYSYLEKSNEVTDALNAFIDGIKDKDPDDLTKDDFDNMQKNNTTYNRLHDTQKENVTSYDDKYVALSNELIGKNAFEALYKALVAELGWDATENTASRSFGTLTMYHVNVARALYATLSIGAQAQVADMYADLDDIEAAYNAAVEGEDDILSLYDLQKALDALTENSLTTSKALEEAKAELDAAIEELKTGKADLSVVEAYKAASDAIDKRVTELEGKVAGILETLETLASTEDLNAVKAELQGLIDALKSGDIAKLRLQLDGLSASYQALGNVVSDNKAAQDAVNAAQAATNAAQEAANADLKDQIDTLSSRLVTLTVITAVACAIIVGLIVCFVIIAFKRKS